MEQCGGNFYYKKLHEKKELQAKIMKMKTKKMLVVVILSLIMAVTSIVPAFAYENDSMAEDYITIKKEDVENNNGTMTYGLVVNEDGSIEPVSPTSIWNIIFGTEIYVGTLTVKEWSGKNVTFSINITSSDKRIKKHAGTIEFYKAARLGIGNLFNSMTFSLRYGAGTKTMSDEYIMSAEGNSKIYIKLTDLYVIDSFDEILSLSNCTRFFRKSDFS